MELEKKSITGSSEDGIGCAVWRQIFCTRYPHCSFASSRCFLSGRNGRFCSADRNIKCKINKDGIWVEKLEDNPAKYIPEELREAGEGEVVKINLNQPMAEIPKELSKYPVATRLSPMVQSLWDVTLLTLS